MKKILLLFSLTFGFTLVAAAQEEASDSIAVCVEEASDSIQAETDADSDQPASFGMLSERVEDEVVREDIIYDLSGRRVDASYRGFVIKNGKKYLQQ